MKGVTLKEAKIVAEKLSSSLQLKAILLFGSAAKYGIGNDLDLLVVFPGDEKTSPQMYQETRKAIRKFYNDFEIDCFVVTAGSLKELWRNRAPFTRLILKEGRVIYMNEGGGRWLKHAREDLEASRANLKLGYYRTACYLAEQALQKAMKGLLIQKKWDLIKIHNIARLIDFGKEYRLDFTLPDDDVDFMDSLYQSRYPGDEALLPGGEPSPEDAERAIKIVESFFQKQRLQ